MGLAWFRVRLKENDISTSFTAFGAFYKICFSKFCLKKKKKKNESLFAFFFCSVTRPLPEALET